MLSAAESDALLLSLSVAARSVAFNLPFAILVAWLLTRTRFAGRTVFDAFVHLPLVLPPVVVGYLLLLLFGVRGPIGGWLYEHFGIQLAFTSTGAALATAVMSFPLVVRSIRIALEGLDRGLEEAARTLGAGPLDRFFSITLPLIAPGILAGAVTAFAAGLGEFGAVITFASNIPGETRTLPLALYTALQTPDGDALAARLALISFSLGLAGPAGGRVPRAAPAPHAGPATMSMLRVQLRKRRGEFSLDVDFGAPVPGITALFGRSGCGKSTLISLIAGLLSPDAGKVQIGDDVLVDTERHLEVDARHRRIGVVFQDARLFPHLSVLGNLQYGARRLPRGTPAPIGFDDVVALLGLGAIDVATPTRIVGRREATGGAGARAAGAAAAAVAG